MFDRSALFDSTHSFPAPIAQPLRRIHRARSAVDEAAAVLETTHQTLHFLAALACADAAAMEGENALEEAVDQVVSNTSPNRWWKFLQVWAQEANGTHLPELRDTVMGVGTGGEAWVRSTENLDRLLADPGIGRSVLPSVAEHLVSASVLEDIQTFIEGLSFMHEWSFLSPSVTWREGSDGFAVAARMHGHCPIEQGLLVKRVDGRLHKGWPVLVRHDSGLSLPLYPLIMECDEGRSIRSRVLFNKAESALVSGATREKWWGDRQTTGLLKRLRSGEHKPFEMDADTLMRLRLLEPVHDRPGTHALASTSRHLVRVEEEGQAYRFWCGLTPEASRMASDVEGFSERIEAIRNSGRGMLRVEPLSLRQEWNGVAAAIYSPSPFGLREVLREEGPLDRNAALHLSDTLLESLETSMQAGMNADTISASHVFVSRDFTASYVPLPVAGSDPEGPFWNTLASLLEEIGSDDLGAFKGAIQALAAPLEPDETPAHRIRLCRAQLPSPADGVTPQGQGPVVTMSGVQMSSPEGVAQRLKDLVEANPGEADVVEGLRVLASDTWPQDTRLTILVQALRHPFASAVEGRDVELAEAILAIDPAHGEASRIMEAQLRVAKDWDALSMRLLNRFSVTQEAQEKRSVLNALSKIFEEEMESTESAFLVYQRALEDNPEDHEAIAGAVRIAESGEHWQELYNLYLHLIDSLSGDRRATIELDAATLAAEKLGLYHKAIAHLEEVLRTRTEDPEAWMLMAHLLSEVDRHHDAISAWESAVRHAPAPDKVVCLTNGSECATKANEWHRCVQFLELRAVYEDRISAAYTCSQIAEVCLDKLGDIGHADSALARAEALAPNDPDVRAAVREVASRSGEALRESTLEAIAAAGEDLDLRETALRRAIQARERIGLTDEELALFFQELVTIAPDDQEPLHQYYELLLKLEDHEEADKILSMRIESVDAGEERVDLLMERAQLLSDTLHRPEDAAIVLREASELRPDDERLAKAHVRALKDAEDKTGVIKALQRRAQLAHGTSKADLLVEAALLEGEESNSASSQIELLESALLEVPDHPQASRLLGDIYVDEGKIAKAIPLMTLWAESSSEAGSTDDAVRSWMRIGEMSDSIQLWERSVDAYSAAKTLNQEHVPAWEGEAAALSALGRNLEAIDQLRNVLSGAAGPLNSTVEKKIQRELSGLTAREGKTRESRTLLEAALSDGGADESTLATLVALCEAEGDWEATSLYRSQLIPLVASSTERAKLYLLQGKALSAKLNRGEEALTALGEALLLDPTSRVVLAALLETALKHSEYSGAVNALDRLADLEEDLEKKGHHLLAKGIIYRDHLRDELRAIGSLNDALDASPLLLEAFEALDAIHVKRLDFESQANSYEKMLSRVSDIASTEDLVFQLLMNYASLQRKLGNLEGAIHSLERAKVLRPGDKTVHEKLARNLEESKGSAEEAIDAYYDLLRHDPKHVESYKALRRLFTRTKETDSAWCACAALVALDAADEKELTFYKANVQGALKVSKPIKDDSVWTRFLYPMGMVADVGVLLDAVYQRHPDWFVADTVEGLGLDSSTRINVKEKGTFTNFARTVPKILGVPVPEFHESEVIQGIRKASTSRPLLMVASDILENAKGKRLRFLLGRALALFHPYHSVVCVRGTRELQGLLDTLHEINREPDSQSPLAVKLKGQMAEGEMDNYVELAPGIFSESTPPSVEQWVEGVEIAATRAGLLLCNDLDVAAKELSASEPLLDSVTSVSLGDNLLRFIVSRDYRTLRGLLGIGLK